jgi:hypothetical protein
MAWACERTIPTERPPLVGEVSANMTLGQHDGSLRPYSRISRPTLSYKHFLYRKNLSIDKALFKFTHEIYHVLNIKSMLVEYLVILVQHLICKSWNTTIKTKFMQNSRNSWKYLHTRKQKIKRI